MTASLLIWDTGPSVTVPSRDVARFSVIMLRVLQPLKHSGCCNYCVLQHTESLNLYCM